ncbi:MAG: ABC transporter substrate-binding protein [Acidimicrobiales bacterium]
MSGVVAALCLVAGACSAPADSGDRAGVDDAAAGGGIGPAELAFQQAPVALDELRLAMVRPASFLPTEVAPAEQGAVILADLLYDGLTEAVGTEGRLRPALARRWWTDADAAGWTFEIDTQRVSAEAVARHLDGLLRAPPNAGVALLLDGVRGVEAVGEGEVHFVLDGPNAGLPWLLSGLSLSIVGPDRATTGRYGVVSEDETGMILEPVLAGDGPVVATTWTATPRRAYDELTLTLVDAAVVPPDDLDDAVGRYGVEVTPRSLTRFYVLNPSSSALADAKVRAAVLAAVDRQRVADEGYGWPVATIDGVAAPTTAGYRAAICGALCGHDPVRVATLLSAAYGIGELDDNGPGADGPGPDGAGPAIELRLAVVGDEQVDPARAVARQLDDVGIEVELLELTPDELATTIRVGGADIYAFGWAAGAGSVDAVVPHVFGSESPANGTGVASERVDELIDRAAAIEDDGARWAVLADAHRQAMAEGLVVPLVAAPSTLVAAPQAQYLVVRADGSLDISSSR